MAVFLVFTLCHGPVENPVLAAVRSATLRKERIMRGSEEIVTISGH